MTELNQYRPDISTGEAVNRRPTLGEVTQATIGQTFGAAYENLETAFLHGGKADPSFRWQDNVKGYEQFSSYLSEARNSEMMAAMKRTVENSYERRAVLADATLGQSLVAELFNPINLVAIPVGIPARTIGMAAFRSGVSVGAVEASAEAILRQPNDPLATYQEGAANIIGATIFGGAIGGAVNIPSISKANAYERTSEAINDYFSTVKDTEKLSVLTPEEIESVPTERPNREVPEEELNNTIADLEARAVDLEEQATRFEVDNDLRDQGEQLRVEAQTLRKELGYRYLDDLRAYGDDPYSIIANKFTDSPLFKMISTPMKRALQSKYPGSVKEKFVNLAHDSGITLALNAVGKAVPPSVYQRTAVSLGELARAHDDLIKLWASETNASTSSVLDLNLSDTARKITRSNDKYESWLNSVNTRRLKGDQNLTDAENNAVRRINEYFKAKGEMLEEVGLIRSQKGLTARVNALEAEIETLKNRRQATTKLNSITAIDGRLKVLERQLKGDQEALAAASNITDTEAFYPRFWDHTAIKKNRQAFSDVIYDWYSKNPFVTDVRGGVFTKVELSTDPEALRKRAEETIDRILGEKDPTNIDNIGVGYGRSKHFRHRQLDIPNALVTDFISTDPLAVMKTYAARIEPRFHFQKMFGKDFAGALFDMELDMLESGASEAEINAMRRDFSGLYDRISGAVIRNPDTLSQKAAFFLREAASFAYMGGAGLASLPDFGRIVMQHELDNVFKGVRAMFDKERVNLAANEVRYSGAALDIFMQSAHMRISEDLSNNFQANSLLNSARNAFYIVNGLAPMTTLAKQLAGIVDSHTIIDYSIKLSQGKLDDQSVIWLARHGIDEDFARQIAKAPWEKGPDGLYMANTDKWTSDEYLNSILDESFTYSRPATRVSKMDDKELTSYFGKQFPGAEIYTNPDIVKPYFAKLQEKHGYKSLLGFMTDMRDVPDGGFSVHIDKDMVRARYERVKKNAENAEKIRSDAKQAFDDGKIEEEFLYHVNNELDAIDLFETYDDYLEYVMLHELHHSVVNQRFGESVASVEDRIDKAAIAYMRDQRSSGEELARNQAMDSLLKAQEEAVTRFRTALNSGVLNQIMSATPADKPLIVDGVAHIPMSIASKFGMKEDSIVKGYARVENGFLGLPFQFYNFLLASVNKTVGAVAHGQVKNRALGSAVMLGLGYMVTQIRTPDYVWDEMSVQDKFARSLDMSGLGSIYSDLFYTSMHTSLAFGGPNITAGLISPKYNTEKSIADGITGLAGAGPSWGLDMVNSMGMFLSGEYGEGAKEFVRNLPGSNLWFIRDEVNQISRGWAN